MGMSSNKGGMGGPNTRAPGGGGMDYNGNPVGGGMGAQFNFGGPGNNSQGRSMYGDVFRMAGRGVGNLIDSRINRPQPGQPLPPGVSKGFGLPPPQQQFGDGGGVDAGDTGGSGPDGTPIYTTADGGGDLGGSQPSPNYSDEYGGLGVPDQNDSQDVNDPNSAFYDSSRGSGVNKGFGMPPPQQQSGGGGLNARADGRDPFEFGEDPEFAVRTPAPVNRFQPRGMIPPAGGRIGNPRQVNPGQGPMQPGRPGGGGKGGMPGPGGPSIGMPVQRPGAPRNIVNQYTRQRTRPR